MKIGDVHDSQGEPEPARQTWTESLAILTEIGHPSAEELRERLGASSR